MRNRSKQVTIALIFLLSSIFSPWWLHIQTVAIDRASLVFVDDPAVANPRSSSRNSALTSVSHSLINVTTALDTDGHSNPNGSSPSWRTLNLVETQKSSEEDNQATLRVQMGQAGYGMPPNKKKKRKQKNKIPESLRQFRKSAERLKGAFPELWSPDDISYNPARPDGLRSCNSSMRELDGIQIHVIGWRRKLGIQRLLNQLSQANYKGWNDELPLYIHIDGESNEEVNLIARDTNWTHGKKYLDFRSQNVGLREMWLSSIQEASNKAGNNTLLLIFEDDIIVSPAYFQWILAMVDNYAPNPYCRNSNLVGFSLSPLTYQNMFKPFHPWSAQDALVKVLSRQFQGTPRIDPPSPPAAFLSVIPSSWGAAYWSDHWNDFDRFVRVRMQLPFYDMKAELAQGKEQKASAKKGSYSPALLSIPGSFVNTWTNSWKRFMVDLMYARGMVMLYPNLRDQKGLACALQDDGEHVNTGNKNRYVVDLIEELDFKYEGELPPFNRLVTFGLDFEEQTRTLLMATGSDFLMSIAKRCTTNCSHLLSRWSRWNEYTVSTDGMLPQICAADAFTSAGTMQHKGFSSTTSDKFLILGSSYLALDAAKLSKALGRTYIPSSEQAMASMDRTVSKDKNASFSALAVSDNIEKTEWPFLHLEFRPWRTIHLTNATGLDEGINGVETIILRIMGKNISVESLQLLFGGCMDQVLAIL